jgi:prevent-host-death family protein
VVDDKGKYVMGMKVAVKDAKATLTELIRRAATGEEVHITRYGETQAVLIGKEQYDRYRRNLMTDD